MLASHNRNECCSKVLPFSAQGVPEQAALMIQSDASLASKGEVRGNGASPNLSRTEYPHDTIERAVDGMRWSFRKLPGKDVTLGALSRPTEQAVG